MLLLLVAAFFLAGGDVSANATQGRYTPSQLLCAQAGLWLLCLAPWALRHPAEARGVNRPWLLAQAAANAGFYFLNLWALTTLPVTWATTILSGATPLCVLVVVFALFAVRPPLREVAWMLLVAGGVTLVLRDPTTPGTVTTAWAGGLAAVGASVLLALSFVAVGRVAATNSVNAINLWYAGLAFVVSLPPALSAPWPALDGWPVLYGLLGLAGQVAIVRATERTGPATASLVAALVPGMAALMAWALYRQPPDGLEILGIVLVVGGCVAIARLEARREQPFDMPFWFISGRGPRGA